MCEENWDIAEKKRPNATKEADSCWGGSENNSIYRQISYSIVLDNTLLDCSIAILFTTIGLRRGPGHRPMGPS